MLLEIPGASVTQADFLQFYHANLAPPHSSLFYRLVGKQPVGLPQPAAWQLPTAPAGLQTKLSVISSTGAGSKSGSFEAQPQR